jgi:hypothetical protein
MVDEEKRAATDILLSIESQLNILSKRIQNSEYLLKTLLGKFNKTQVSPISTETIPSIVTNVDIINKENFDIRPRTNRFEEMAAATGVDLDNTRYIPKSSTEDLGIVEAPVRGSSRSQRGPKPKGPKSSVSQIVNRGNDVLFLANVEVLDANNELVSQTRTNNKGRWLMALAPGDYQVHVTKRFPPESGKKPIDTMYSISVPPSDKPLELDPFVIDMG